MSKPDGQEYGSFEPISNPPDASQLLPLRMSSEELLAKMREHFKERKAMYDALDDHVDNRVIANSGLEGLQTAESENTLGENKPDAVNTDTVINEDKTTRYPQKESDHLVTVSYAWSYIIRERAFKDLAGKMAIALLRLDECNFDHDCGGEGDYPRCKECRAVRIMRGLIVELGAHGIGSEGLTP